MHLPFEVADYVDFYTSEHHAANAGRIFRPAGPPLPPNWKHMPIGYHGRSGSLVRSGTPVVRPCGQLRPGEGPPDFGPSERLDFEAELGFVIGPPSLSGEAVPLDRFRTHVFGVCLVNDWSARDIQAWESVPLGPFLGKSFATSVSSWVVPLDALEAARAKPPPRDVAPLPYLCGTEDLGYDITLEVTINGEVVSRPPFSTQYWTPAQLVAHCTANGARLRTGDLLASGTVSGPEPAQRGCLLELSWGGAEPIKVGGSTRSFLLDGDEVEISATAPGPGGSLIGFGSVSGRVFPARRA
jgi:fumarylacetoacetase